MTMINLIALFNLVASSSLWEVTPSYLWEVAPSCLWEVVPVVFGNWLPSEVFGDEVETHD